MNGELVKANIQGAFFSTNLVKGQTRKYHALLMNSTAEFERQIVVSTTRDAIAINAMGEFDFSGHYFGPDYTTGVEKHLLNSYYLPYPTQIFQFGNTKVKKVIEFSETDFVLKIIYTVNSPENYTLQIEPLYTYRNFHKLGSEIDFESINIEYQHNKQRIRLSEEATILIQSNLEFHRQPGVSHNHYYPVEAERGYEAYEDLHSIGIYQVNGTPGITDYEISFKLRQKLAVRKFFRAPLPSYTPDNNSILSDITRFIELYPNNPQDFSEYLISNARQFIVKSEKRFSLLAGYPWFAEWSRDTFISFKGILLALGRFHEAQRVLLDWSRYISVGLLPNTMEGIHYNSIDGILWYFQALWYYWEQTKDKETVTHILPKLERVVYAFVRGSKYGIQIDQKGYLVWTDTTKALTWMDAAVDGNPIIQRSGVAVEIQALWYNALQILEKLALLTQYKLVNMSIIDELEKMLEQNFEKDFWSDELGYYADRISLDGQKNFELRPNQLALFSLTFHLGLPENGEKMLKVVQERLLTPVGLRTLAPGSEKYVSEYKGSQYERDLIYHQGTIWPWLLVLYYGSVIKLGKNSDSSKAEVKNHLTQFWGELSKRKLLHIPEMFQDKNLEPVGAVSQCWSVAAILETILLIHDS